MSSEISGSSSSQDESSQCLLLEFPTEVTCLIFDLYFTSHSLVPVGKQQQQKPLLPEIVISNVCRKWRAIAVNYPWLWTRFFFRASSVKVMQNSLNRFDMYIKRSGSQNLELFLDFHEEVEVSFERHREQCLLMKKAVQLVERWKFVTLVRDIDLMDDYCHPGLIDASAPNLEYFAYLPAYPYTRTPEIPNLNPTMFQGGAPKLRYFQVDCVSPNVPPLSNVTTLRIELGQVITDKLFSWNAFFQILSIPSLTNLSVDGEIFDIPMGIIAPTIIMNNLKHLRYTEKNIYMTDILPFLRAPLLETLWVRTMGMHHPSNPFAASQPEPYFFPSLQSLNIKGSAQSPESAYRLMRVTSNIKNLFMSANDVEEESFLFGLLAHGHSTFDEIDQCWPNIVTFTADLGCWSDRDILLDFVRSQSRARDLKSKLNLRIFNGNFLMWSTLFEAYYQELHEHCSVGVIEPDKKKSIMQPVWPPGVDYPDYALINDPFEPSSNR